MEAERGCGLPEAGQKIMAKKGFETVKAGKTPKPLSKKEIEKQLCSGKLTEEQAIELLQKYMDSLEYKKDQRFVTSCGGIKPLPILPPPDEEE